MSWQAPKAAPAIITAGNSRLAGLLDADMDLPTPPPSPPEDLS
jgi:hypothetical protein